MHKFSIINKYYEFGVIYLLFSFLFIFLIGLFKLDFIGIIVYKHLEYFIFMSFLLLFYHLIRKNESKNFVIISFFISVFFKLFYGFWHYYLFDQIQGFPFSAGWNFDELKYYLFAKDFTLSGGGSIFEMAEKEQFPLSYMGYPYVLFVLYKIFGINLYVHIILNSILMSFASIVFYMFFLKIFQFSKNEKIIMMGILIFSPILTLYAVLNLKDALLTLELGLVIYTMHNLVFFSKNIFNKIFYLLGTLILLYFIFFSRVQFSFLMGLYLIIMIYYNSNKYLFVLFFSIFLFFIISVLYENYEKYFIFFSYNFLEMQFERLNNWTIFQNKFLLMILPFLAPFAIFLPLPIKVHFESNSAVMNMNTELFYIPMDIELTFLYAVIILNLPNIFAILKSNNIMKAYAIFSFIFLISLYITNYITYEKHKLLFILLSFPFFVKSFSYVLTKKSKQLLFVLIVLATLSFVYSIIRVSLKGEI